MALLGRDTAVSGPLPEGVLLLETFRGKEALGTPFVYNATLLSADPAIAPDAVLGQPLTIRIKLDSGGFRYFSGIVTYFAKTGAAMHHTRYAAVMNPKLALLDYTRDCRIFFDAVAPELAVDLLSQKGADVDPDALEGDYRTHEYCVQYRESYFNFIHRLFEEEGVYYFFKHAQGKHTMVLADSGAAHGMVPGYENVLCLRRDRNRARDEQHFWSLSVAGALYPGTFTSLQGYDYSKPRPHAIQLHSEPSTAAQPGADYDDYDNPGGLTVKADAEADVTVRLDGDCVANTTIEVEGNTMGLGVGDLVTLTRPVDDGDYNPFWKQEDLGKEYLITSASYRISINQYEAGDATDADEPYRATYTLLDAQTRFRPRRRARKPRIEGPQTALVVGPAGDEIYTDKFGRVKVQFDWDRLGQSDQKSSCWVRVAQLWAGKQWGAIHIPRIGHEVIVEFLDGDPDRPIVTGHVYNADNMPPYALPDNKTQSGIKSRSSKNGTASNFNELRFEDLKGSEEVYLQAEKDMNILVKNDESRLVDHDRSKHVKHDETTHVDGNRSEEVGRDETITIHGRRSETVDRDESITISGARTENVGKDESITIGGNRTESVGKNESISIGGNRAITLGKDEKVAIAGARQVEIAKADSLSVAAARAVKVGGDHKLEVGKAISINAAEEISIQSGAASITLKKDGTIILKGKDITLNASGKINGKASGEVVFKGSKISGN